MFAFWTTAGSRGTNDCSGVAYDPRCGHGTSRHHNHYKARSCAQPISARWPVRSTFAALHTLMSARSRQNPFRIQYDTQNCFPDTQTPLHSMGLGAARSANLLALLLGQVKCALYESRPRERNPRFRAVGDPCPRFSMRFCKTAVFLERRD